MPKHAIGSRAGEIEVHGIVVGLFQENVFLIRSAGKPETVLIDPGDEPNRIAGFIASRALVPVAIVNTHAHLDHIGGVRDLQEQFRVPFYLHAGDEPLLHSAPEHAKALGVRIPKVPRVDRYLKHRQTLDLAGLAIQVLHTPGHTPGGISLIVRGRAFVGDTLFNGSIGRTDLPGGDAETLMRSIRDQLLPLPDETIVHAGHGPDTTIGEEKRSNPFLARPRAETRADREPA